MELGISTLGHNIEYGIINKSKYKDLTDLFLDSTEACLKLSEDQGFNVCEIIIESPDIFKNEIRRNFIELCDSFKIKKQVHGPFIDMGLCSHNNLISIASIEAYVKAAELSKEIGAKIFTIHPGVANFLINSIHGYNKKQLIKAVKLLLDELTDLNLTICIENMPKNANILLTEKEIVSFFSDVNRDDLFFTYDTSHAWTNEVNVSKLWEGLDDRIKNIHIVENFEQNSDTHPRLGSGKINFQEIFNIIKSHEYLGSLIIELSSASESLPSIEFIKQFL
jgi:sugar phosphate isomerase/epimerase